jgi:phage shock protein C
MKDRLYRSRQKRIIGGVAGGLGDYLNIDPVIIRIITVILTLLNGIGILVYIIMWIVVPEEPVETQFESSSSSIDSANDESSTEQDFAEVRKKENKGRTVFGAILILIGLIFLGERFIPAIDFKDIFPLAFIILGVSLLWNSFKKQNNEKL